MTAREFELDPCDPSADSRLKPLVDLIERRAVDVLSLDCFDTLVGRAVARPTLAFRLMGDALREAGILPAWCASENFMHLRATAEKRARDRLGTHSVVPEVMLAEIYEELTEVVPPARRAEAMALELEVEARVSIADLALLALAERAQANGIKVAVVSDTYLSGEQLATLLQRSSQGRFKPDLILTSSDNRTNKGHDLFKLLVQRVGVPAGRVAHLGDNHEADVVGARRHGLLAFHFTTSTELERQVLRLEESRATPREASDAGWTYLRNRALWRCENVPDDLAPYFRLGAFVYGPAFTAFADWAVTQMRAFGMKAAACFMREGEFLAEIIRRAAEADGYEVRCAPLYISRQAAFRASLTELDEKVLYGALSRRRPPTVAAFCASLGLSPEELKLSGATSETPLSEETLVNTVFSRVLKEPMRSRVRADAREQRRLLLEHLAEVAPGSEGVAMVDLGWGGSIQKFLHSALVSAGSARPTLGLYMATTPRAAEVMLAGSPALGFITSCGQYERDADLIARSPEVLEQLCMGAVGSTLCYKRVNGRVEPVLGTRVEDPFADKARAAMRAGVLYFQRQWYALCPRTRRGEAVTELARESIVRSIVRPLSGEAALVGQWRHDDNFGSTDSSAIADAAQAPQGCTAAQLASDPWTYWPGGLAAQTDLQLADELAAHLLLGLFDEASPEPIFHVNTALPMRYQAVDRMNEFIKRQFPLLHAGAKMTPSSLRTLINQGRNQLTRRPRTKRP